VFSLRFEISPTTDNAEAVPTPISPLSSNDEKNYRFEPSPGAVWPKGTVRLVFFCELLVGK
jgi:hypothetical protein